jgi:hypothetical protein
VDGLFPAAPALAKGHTAAACLGGLDNQEQLVGLGFIAVCPFTGSVADAGNEHEPAPDGSASMHLDPALKREPSEGSWVTFCPFPISRNGNVQLDERLGKRDCQAVVGNHAMDWRDASESRQQAGSLCHQLTGGSQPGGAAIGAPLCARARASTALANNVAVFCRPRHLTNLPTSVR